MLQVLTAQIVAEERERAIQRRLREADSRHEARLAKADASAVRAIHHDPSIHSAGRRCGACTSASAAG